MGTLKDLYDIFKDLGGNAQENRIRGNVVEGLKEFGVGICPICSGLVDTSDIECPHCFNNDVWLSIYEWSPEFVQNRKNEGLYIGRLSKGQQIALADYEDLKKIL